MPTQVHDGRRVTIDVGAVAQLAVAVLAPALERAAIHDGACVVHSRTDFEGLFAQVHDDRHVAVDGGAVAQLAVAVQAPALEREVLQEGARVGISHSENQGCPAQVHDFDRRVTIGGSVVAELAYVVPSPALERAALVLAARIVARN